MDDQAIARIGLLAAGAAHELASPLNTIVIILSDWERTARLRKDPELTADVARMQSEVARCRNIVADLLSVLGGPSGQPEVAVPARQFLDQAIRAWNALRQPRKLEYLNHLALAGEITSDLLLRQLLFSLLDNALEASPDHIRVEALDQGSFALVSISDLGPGFTSTMLKNFGQAGASTKGGGTGLFLARQILQQIGGRLAMKNGADGGAVVEVLLPIGPHR